MKFPETLELFPPPLGGGYGGGEIELREALTFKVSRPEHATFRDRCLVPEKMED